MRPIGVVCATLMLAALVSTRPQFVSITPYGYQMRMDTFDGTSRRETGSLLAPGTPDEQWVVEGEFSWVDPDGKPHRTTFVADKDGYRSTQDTSAQAPSSSQIGSGAPALSIKAALAGGPGK